MTEIVAAVIVGLGDNDADGVGETDPLLLLLHAGTANAKQAAAKTMMTLLGMTWPVRRSRGALRFLPRARLFANEA